MTEQQMSSTGIRHGHMDVARCTGVLAIGIAITVALTLPATVWARGVERGSATQAPGLAMTFNSTPVKAGAKDAPVMGATPALAVGDNALEVTVKDGTGRVIADADVSVVFSMAAMPAMSMPAMRNEVKLKAAGAGVYRATTPLAMGGRWGVTVLVKQGGKDVGKREWFVVAK